MQRNKIITVFQGRVPNAAAGRHLQLHTCPLHCQSIDHRQLCRGEIKSKIKKTNDKKQNQNEETKSKSLHCQPIDHVQLSRGEITPTSDPLHDPQSPTSHFLKNFLKMENNLKINVQTIPIISFYHLCLLQNGTTFPQGATKPLSELCHPLQ